MSQIFFVLASVAQLYALLLVVRALISWVPDLDPYNPIVRLLYQVTEPVLDPVRRLLPAMGGMDFSPIVVFFALQIIAGLLRDLGRSL